jgi:hypothetical protein
LQEDFDRTFGFDDKSIMRKEKFNLGLVLLLDYDPQHANITLG